MHYSFDYGENLHVIGLNSGPDRISMSEDIGIDIGEIILGNEPEDYINEIVEYFFQNYEDVLKDNGAFLVDAIKGHIERGRIDLEEDQDITEERGTVVAALLVNEMSKRGVYEARKKLIYDRMYEAHVKIENPTIYHLIETKLAPQKPFL